MTDIDTILKSKTKTNFKSKITGILLIIILLIQVFSLVGIIGVHKAFAQNDTYTVQNEIYFEAIGLGKSEPDIYRIVVEESTSINDKDDKNPSWKADEVTNSFDVNSSSQSTKIVGLMERQDIVSGTFSFADRDFTVTENTSYGVLATYYNGTMEVENASEYFSNFERPTTTYPAIEKLLLFQSPVNYARKYCSENALNFVSIVNSTYNEIYDIDTLNIFNSRKIKSDWIITEEVDEEYLMKDLMKLGSDLNQDVKFPWIIALIIVAAVLLVPTIVNGLVEMKRIDATRSMAERQMLADQNVTITAINAERDVQLALVQAKAENEALILAMLQNGSITFEEAEALLAGIGSDYSNLLANRSNHLIDALGEYYNHTQNLWGSYLHGLGIGTSWTDYLQWIIIAVVVIIIVVVIYRLLIRRKDIGGPSNFYYIQG